MIEIVYNKPVGDKKGKCEVKLPRSVRQIGKESDSRKIYIEDYVMSYINSLAKKKSDKLTVGVLLGNSMCDKEQYLFIKGAIKVKDFNYNEGKIIFNERSWSGIYADIKKYFNALNIMGWFVIIEDVNDFHFVNMRKTNIDNFAGNDKTFFVFETENNEGSFYFYENGDMVKENGYYVYYERNENMQEYMLVREDSEVKKEPAEVVVQPNVKNMGRRLNFMYGICAAMVVGLIVMSINIFNGSLRMSNLEKMLDGLSLKYLTWENDRDVKPEVVEVKANVSETVAREEESASVAETKSEDEPTTRASTTSKFKFHTVAKGETLVSISKMYYGDDSKVDEIMSLNAIKDPNKIYLGQVIKLP